MTTTAEKVSEWSQWLLTASCFSLPDTAEKALDYGASVYPLVSAVGVEDAVRVGRKSSNLLERSQTVIPPGWPGLPAGVSNTCDTRDGR